MVDIFLSLNAFAKNLMVALKYTFKYPYAAEIAKLLLGKYIGLV